MELIGCEFGTIIEAPDDALDWLEERLGMNSVSKEGNWDDYNIMSSRDEGTLLLSSFDDCMPTKIDYLIEAVCEMQIKFNLDEPWHLTWANIWTDGVQWYASGEASVSFKGEVTKAKSLFQWVEETKAALLQGIDVSGSEKSLT
ncbi:hypothetical protein IT157_10985 [bacterium]|nr:hypothetical protein [bacterium]